MISGLTGAVYELPRDKYDALVLDPNSFSKIYLEIANELAERGFLFEGEESERELESRLIETITAETEKKDVVFMMCPTDFCPVGCTYCFSEDRVMKAERSVMSPDMIESAFRSIADIRTRYSSRLSTMCLYGGEPFQDYTHSALELIFKRSSEMGLKIAAFTSGLYTEKFRDLIEVYKKNISTIAVTLDGTEASHSLMRKIGKSFPRAVATIDMLISIGVPVLIKTNVNRLNIKDIPKLVSFYKEKGWWDNPLTSYEITPIQYRQISLERDTNYDLEMAFEFLDMLPEYPDLRRFDILPMADNKYGLIDAFGLYNFQKDKIPLQAVVPRMHGCPSYTKHFFVFSADGDFYLCNEEVGLKESSYGHFSGDGQHKIDFERMEKYYSRNVCKLSHCQNCAYAYFCGGGCGHHAGGEELAMCGTIEKDIGELVRRWAGEDHLPSLPRTGMQLIEGSDTSSKMGSCKPSSKDGMRMVR